MAEFTVYPAIDMRGGKCVRLLQGDYNQETVYGDSPFDMAKSFADAGARWIHMVDLDGAKEKRRINHEHVVKAAKELPAAIQVGGGIRTEEDVAYYLENGVDRVILGSVAVSHPEFCQKMLEMYGEQIVIGLDARNGYVAVNGWLETSEVTAEALGQQMAAHGAETFIFTDIEKDGTLNGPNVEAIASLAKATGKDVIASGGVSVLEDLHVLQRRADEGVAGAIVGKAIYTGRVDTKTALKEVDGPC
ncbi:1-(5-phosphoribosyl)-5-[(5-phosphoribosylamino)methylideneamino] imidazole-4-carboxamide isomerase [Salsuginibacillus halophilus]|uniref:1-(5-phosphoribosyl)-5-[(5-phosphoribosylamino)methylideneamino] imidazole-4-carboxamide isomerase n=1 Tax=Salsuginibacillus halophilus TaxID=517424 RepID=A0A2P8H980_9BACI|nr:1-(5-phosphoribosyl)-5-[(5-phosphoribosylamino)methylideneamino]imidazole-4-carboxamide isomerase [Salsuginibacillus halophilus]PSL42764.1 1-(5-phosphoribosyl)-5-[(5-phosphoribosylamino)methylideneamino] imidazole-4-carboxamide isomerase [Salsuginibacillus halophilus]